MPLAVQYRMPLAEFWYGDTRLLEVYQKAYMRDKSYTAWLNGAYIFEADSKAVYNGNRAKRSDPVQQYAEWKDPIEKMKKLYSKQENYEVIHRNQQMWFYDMINR